MNDNSSVLKKSITYTELCEVSAVLMNTGMLMAFKKLRMYLDTLKNSLDKSSLSIAESGIFFYTNPGRR